MTSAGQRAQAGQRLIAMRSSPARLLAARSALVLPLALALALAACGSVTGQRAGTSAAVTPAQASPRTTVGQSACGPPPPRHAWAVDVTTAGRINWQTPLKTRGNPSGPAVSPVPVGPVAVFAQDGIVHGIRLADGHPLWSWPGGQDLLCEDGKACGAASRRRDEAQERVLSALGM